MLSDVPQALPSSESAVQQGLFVKHRAVCACSSTLSLATLHIGRMIQPDRAQFSVPADQTLHIMCLIQPDRHRSSRFRVEGLGYPPSGFRVEGVGF